MGNEYSNIDRIAMLFELGLNYQEELKRAAENNDTEKVNQLSKLIDCIRTLMNEIEK